ncbi:MAG TPA: methyltransferase domain-containing protein [Dehalococcoidia bacterium]|nr:methyltransferase domain-containing protein [Dehalococcoidia bacterium]
MSQASPQLMSAALFEKDAHVLAAHRKSERPPFAGQWLLPMALVREDEAAEDALRRHARDQFGVTLGAEQFVETVYLQDPDDRRQYVTNIFRAPIEGGPLRFNAGGDYDDARWVTAADLDQLWMPPALRDPLARIMTDPDYVSEIDWSQPGEARPLGEHPAPEGPPPDNRAGWDTISAAYQEHRYGDRYGERLMWSWRASEDDLYVLGAVRGKRALVLGCGGGQDVVALARLGATAVGIDQSPAQLAYARRYAGNRRVDNASFVEGDLTDLSRFDDASFDFAISIHALDYVADVERALAEAARVLKPGGVLAVAVKHPFDVHIDGGPPYSMSTPYWSDHSDWTWEFPDGVSARFRAYYRTVSRWVDLLVSAGFDLERMWEPKEDTLPAAAGDTLDNAWMALLPYTLVLKARKR